MRNRVIIALFFLMIIFAACKSPTSPDPEPLLGIRIEGVVKNLETGAPIAGMAVRRFIRTNYTLLGWEEKTVQKVTCDQEGRYTLEFTSRGCSGMGYVLPGLDYSGYMYVNGQVTIGYEVRCTTDVQIADFSFDPW